MKFKTLQWNIGGGKIKDIHSLETSKYTHEGLGHIVEEISKYDSDIITLQEIHQSSDHNQAKIIAEKLGYRYFIYDIYSESHLEDGQHLGQAIISKFPIENNSFTFFENPMLEVVTPEGKRWQSHNKGISKVTIRVDSNKILEVATLHLVPFRKFKVDILSETFVALRKNIQDLIYSKNNLYLLQGDFNFDNESLTGLVDLAYIQLKEVLQTEATTPRNRKYDHIIYRNIEHLSSETISSVLTDHYPIVSIFEI